jgi:hypothetical protein
MKIPNFFSAVLAPLFRLFCHFRTRRSRYTIHRHKLESLLLDTYALEFQNALAPLVWWSCRVEHQMSNLPERLDCSDRKRPGKHTELGSLLYSTRNRTPNTASFPPAYPLSCTEPYPPHTLRKRSSELTATTGSTLCAGCDPPRVYRVGCLASPSILTSRCGNGI